MAFPADYTKYQEITIDATKVASDLTDFVVFINLSDLVKAGADIFDTCRSDGGDIRATKSDGTTELAIDVATIDTTAKTGEVYVRFTGTLSSSTDTVIRLYYNGTDTAYATTATYGRNNVWQDYEFVFHFNEDPSGTAPQMVDSTGNGDLTSQGSMTAGDIVDGLFGDGGKAVEIDGVDDKFSRTNKAFSSNDPVSLTVVSQQKAAQGSQSYRIMSQASSGNNSLLMKSRSGADGGFYFHPRTNASVEARIYQDTVSEYMGGDQDTTQFGHFKCNDPADEASVEFYVDGSKTTHFQQEGAMSAGQTLNFDSIFSETGSVMSNCIHDELRFANFTYTDDFVTTEYNNMQSPATFYSTGDEEGSGTDYPMTASVGTFTLTGIANALQIGYLMTATVIAFTLTGIATALQFGRTLVADVVSFTLTGIDAVLIAGGRLVAEVGSFTLTGIDAILRVPITLTAEAGSFVLTGISNTLTLARGIVADVTSFTLTGIDVTFALGKGIMADVASFTLTGIDATLTYAKGILASVGEFTLTGMSAGLKPSNIWSNMSKTVASWVNKDKS